MAQTNGIITVRVVGSFATERVYTRLCNKHRSSSSKPHNRRGSRLGNRYRGVCTNKMCKYCIIAFINCFNKIPIGYRR